MPMAHERMSMTQHPMPMAQQLMAMAHYPLGMAMAQQRIWGAEATILIASIVYKRKAVTARPQERMRHG